MNSKFTLGILLILILSMSAIGVVNAQSGGDVITIVLSDDSVAASDASVQVAGHQVTITAAGTYSLSGTLFEGQVIVDTKGTVNLNLEGLTISNTSGPAFNIQDADGVIISLVDGTQNNLSNSAAHDEAEGVLNAAIYSDVDLTINGTGALAIEANAIDGIVSKESLTINGNPVMAINAGDDALQVETVFTITGGELYLVAGGGMNNTVLDETLSGKGIKAEEYIVIDGGNITIDASDDAINSKQDFVMNAGTLTITALGKGVHSTYNLVINDGTIDVINSEEGLEAGFITINSGDIHITATDDGINISEPDDIPAPSLYYLYIHGGHIVVDAEGDGLDSNGSIEMTDGVVIVNGPTISGNGALDYDGTFEISGGTLIAVSNSNMSSAPSTTSSQYSVIMGLSAALEANSLVHIQNSAGETLVTFAPSKTFQSVVFSSPDMVEGETYTVYSGGSSDGTETDGLYADGTYTPGEQIEEFTISSAVTQVGSVQGQGHGGGPGGGRGNQTGMTGELGTPPDMGTPPDGMGAPEAPADGTTSP